MGDVFSVTYLQSKNALAMACQNTAILLVQVEKGAVVDVGGTAVPQDERSTKVFHPPHFALPLPLPLERTLIRLTWCV